MALRPWRGPALAALALTAWAWPAAPAGALELRLTGVDVETMVAGEERDEIRAEGDGATLVIHDRVGCQLVGARCEELHGGTIATGRCEDAYGRGTLRLERRTIRFFVAGRRCPHANADVERGVLISRSGFIEYVMRTRWRGATGDREGVRIRLRTLRTMPRSELTCNGCQYLVQVVHSLVPARPTHTQAITAVENACRWFPEQYQGLCSIVVERYGRAIVDAVLEGLDAGDSCRKVGACPTRRALASSVSGACGPG